jgi:hypothetical protein
MSGQRGSPVAHQKKGASAAMAITTQCGISRRRRSVAAAAISSAASSASKIQVNAASIRHRH